MLPIWALSRGTSCGWCESDNRHLLFTSDDPDAPLREGVPWGGLAAITGLDENIQLLEGRAATDQVYTLRLPSGALAPLVEAVAATDMLDAEGLLVGDQVQLRFGDRGRSTRRRRSSPSTSWGASHPSTGATPTGPRMSKS